LSSVYVQKTRILTRDLNLENLNYSNFSLKINPPFNFRQTVCSHGWKSLAPNSWDDERNIFSRPEHLSSGKVVMLHIRSDEKNKTQEIQINVDHIGELSDFEADEIKQRVGHMLRLDEDFTDFYTLFAKKNDSNFDINNGFGRLLRSPGFFEDIVKTMCTTNIQWGGTKRMVAELVNTFGESFPGDKSIKAFPLAKAIAGYSFEEFSSLVRLGYRAEYIYFLARDTGSGDLDLHVFFDELCSTEEIKKQLLSIKGIGNYAAANLLMLTGRYYELPMDSVFHAFVSKKYFKGKRVPEKKAAAVYKKWGKWKSLVYWYDMTKEDE